MSDNIEHKEKIPQEASSMLLLDIMKNEYIHEQEIKKSFEDRASLFLGFIVTVFTIFINYFPFSKLIRFIIYESTKMEIIFSTLVTCIMILSFVYIIGAFTNLINVIRTREYRAVNLKNLIDEENIIKPIEQTAKELTKHYYDVVISIRGENSKKEVFYSNGIRKSIISFSLVAISFILLSIII